MHRSARVCSTLLALFFLAIAAVGCKVDLNTNLTEQEANQILAVLLENGIAANKVLVDEASITVQIDEEDLLDAINLLKHSGFPKEDRESLGTVFQKTGIMSSPFEERVRFIYALSQELSETLNEIDGVHTARVHIVLPDAPDLGEDIVPSSAAVFIKHRPGVDLDFFTPQIKRLVSNAIEGVEYDKVSIVLVEAEKIEHRKKMLDNPPARLFFGADILPRDQAMFEILIIAVLMIVVALLIAVGLVSTFLYRNRRKVSGRSKPPSEDFEPA